MSNQYINGIYNNAIPTVTNATQTWVESNFVPNSTGTISNLTVTNKLTQNRMFVQYTNSGSQSSSGSVTTMQFPTQSVSVNASGLTISGSNNTTFTNSSGSTQYWVISSLLVCTNNDSASQKLGVEILYNGVSSNKNSQYYANGLSVSIMCSGPQLVNNNDQITIGFITSGSTVQTISFADITIMQV